ncbi:hypothetical protein, partial [Corynebacterium sp.]|uniref:hypothetical protein n=1 Tax=Corynebacterium sp. TaxID=1720 RepID=UPI0029082722
PPALDWTASVQFSPGPSASSPPFALTSSAWGGSFRCSGECEGWFLALAAHQHTLSDAPASPREREGRG